MDVNKTGFERPAQVLGSSGKRSSISFCVHLKVENALHIGMSLKLVSADGFCSMKLLILELFNDTASISDVTWRRMASEDTITLTSPAGRDLEDGCRIWTQYTNTENSPTQACSVTPHCVYYAADTLDVPTSKKTQNLGYSQASREIQGLLRYCTYL